MSHAFRCPFLNLTAYWVVAWFRARWRSSAAIPESGSLRWSCRQRQDWGPPQSPVLYVSAEESAHQIRLRAERLGVQDAHVHILSATDLDAILATATEEEPALLIVDSIQTVTVDEIASSAGSVSQVRECTARLMQWGKSRNVPVFIIGHVTKEGTIAGPRVLEHMVDAVLYLEGERYGHFRVLRAVKNRFGSTDEVGVFEMAEEGLREVRNPSAAFLEERNSRSSGSSVAVTVEGSRPILVEVQALATTSAFRPPPAECEWP